MKSRYSLHLGRPFGIKVSVHWTFTLLIVWIVFISLNRGLEPMQIVMHILFVLALFVCVVLHEFGHSLVAIKFGSKVESITLLPIGGMANMSEMPEKPREEFLVSAAGPAVNIVISALPLFEAYVNLRKSRFEILPVMKNEEFTGIHDLENINDFLLIQKAVQ